jgi:hypothetical protein
MCVITLISAYEIKTKRHSLQWILKCALIPKKARLVRLNVKVMLIHSFSYVSAVHHAFVSDCQTVGVEFYLEVFNTLLSGHMYRCGCYSRYC